MEATKEPNDSTNTLYFVLPRDLQSIFFGSNNNNDFITILYRLTSPRKKKEDPNKELRGQGSTRLPPYPRVKIDYDDFVNKEFIFSDVPQLRCILMFFETYCRKK